MINIEGGEKMDFLTSSTHLHITTWVIALILFFIAALGITKSKGVVMTLRLFYILIIITGGAIVFKYHSGMYDVKALFGILVIGMMEMILTRQQKGKSTGVFWILFAIFLFVTLFMGFKLPMGFNFLASF